MREHACSSVTVFDSFLLYARMPPPKTRLAMVPFVLTNEIPRTIALKGTDYTTLLLHANYVKLRDNLGALKWSN